MAKKPLVLIHGWSDTSASFRRLANLIHRETGRAITLINLADYKSLDDEVTFDDLASAMSGAWESNKLPFRRRSVDVIVHSTGGLVIREWLARRFTASTAPVHHLVMLAPANFGSPLAHKGRSLLGRVVKGWKSEKIFQTGEKILKGLELASPYSWNLAMRDRFGSKQLYGSGHVLTTVLVGNRGYRGISSVANEDGSDGTVRVSTSNMNCAYILADFAANPHEPRLSVLRAREDTAFGVMDGENHSTIVAKDGGPKNPATLARIIEGLEITDERYDGFCERLAEETRRTMLLRKDDATTHGYQNTVVFVRDQFGTAVKDYFIEFYLQDDDTGWFEEFFHRDAIRKVHANGEDPSYRSIYVDCTTLHRRIDRETEGLEMSLTAIPEFRMNRNVGYRTFTDDDIGGVRLSKQTLGRLFQENRTALVEIVLKREQSPDVFKIKRM
ncbi:MAG: alpha/beta hydrolase [Planctomycetes bacterium]|nr:alpha/beta hydrolase [Planctomycetota bacterium]